MLAVRRDLGPSLSSLHEDPVDGSTGQPASAAGGFGASGEGGEEENDGHSHPPHIFTVAEDAHRRLLRDRMNQSVVLLGESGSGKTEALLHIVEYLASCPVLDRAAPGQIESATLAAAKKLQEEDGGKPSGPGDSGAAMGPGGSTLKRGRSTVQLLPTAAEQLEIDAAKASGESRGASGTKPPMRRASSIARFGIGHTPPPPRRGDDDSDGDEDDDVVELTSPRLEAIAESSTQWSDLGLQHSRIAAKSARKARKSVLLRSSSGRSLLVRTQSGRVRLGAEAEAAEARRVQKLEEQAAQEQAEAQAAGGLRQPLTSARTASSRAQARDAALQRLPAMVHAGKVSAPRGQALLCRRLHCLGPVLRAFTGASTLSNGYASRAGVLVRLFFATRGMKAIDESSLRGQGGLHSDGFDGGMGSEEMGRLSPHPLSSACRAGDIVGAAVEVTPVDAERVTHCSPGERNFSVFYAMVKGAPTEMRERFRIPSVPAVCRYTARGGEGAAPPLPGGGAAFGGTPTDAEIAEAVKAAKAGRKPKLADSDVALFQSVQSSLHELGMSAGEMDDVWRVLAAILAVGDISFTTEQQARQFSMLRGGAAAAGGELSATDASRACAFVPGGDLSSQAGGVEPPQAPSSPPPGATEEQQRRTEAVAREVAGLHRDAGRFAEAAALLDVDPKQLLRCLTHKATSDGSWIRLDVDGASERRDRLARAMYQELVDKIIGTLNGALGAFHPVVRAALTSASEPARATMSSSPEGVDSSTASRVDVGADGRRAGDSVGAVRKLSSNIRAVAVLDLPGYETRPFPQEHFAPLSVIVRPEAWPAGGATGLGRNGLQ